MKDSIDFGSMDIPKLFRKLLIPTVLGMIFSAIFIITDGIFVGKGIGSDALAAVNITAPLFLINTGVALMFGIGASVVASIHLSQGKVKVARINITQAVVVSSLLLIAYAAIILCNVEKIALLLGSSPRLLPLAVEYMHWFVPFLVFSALLSSGMFFVRLDGSPNYAMVCNIIPALLNIGLDYLFIGVMGLDAVGAALGTTIAQAVSVIVSLTVIIKKGTGIKLRRSDLRPKRHTMKNILKVGVPVALQDGFIQISFIAITIFANQRGLNDAAAVGIVEKIIGILFLVPSSMLSTISALASQNIGAGKHDRARLTLRYVLYMTVGYGLAAATIVQFLSVPFVGLFTNDGAVQILGGQYLRSYAWDCVFAGVHFCLSGYFYAYGLSIVSFIHNSISIVCARIPLSYYAATHFPDTLFPMGCASPAGSMVSIVICVGVFVWMNKHTEKYMERT